MALQQIYDVSGSSETYDEFVKIYDQIYELNPDYYKAYLNHAGMIIKAVRKKLELGNLDTFPDYKGWVEQEQPNIDSATYDDALSQIEEAIVKLKKVQKLKPDFINGYYKMGEAVTIKIMLMNKLEKPVEQKNLEKKTAEESFSRARAISEDAIACKYCEYAFYQLIGDNDRAEKIKEEIAAAHRK